MFQDLVDHLYDDGDNDYANITANRMVEASSSTAAAATATIATIDTGVSKYELKLIDASPQLVDRFNRLATEKEHTSGGKRKSSAADNYVDVYTTEAEREEKTGRKSLNKKDRERMQRVKRDAFRRKVLELANQWIGCCENSETIKRNIVISDDQRKFGEAPRRRGPPKKKCTTTEAVEIKSEDLFNIQNGYFYYNIMCTKEIESLVNRAVTGVQQTEEHCSDVDKLAMVADIYLRVMLHNEIRPSVFIKFDDSSVPVLFARQTKASPDTCITGSPGRYWSKLLHLNNNGTEKSSQHVTLQRVRSGRLIQDSTFVLVGEGPIDQICNVCPERFVSMSRNNLCYKEMYRYIQSVPEVDLTFLSWEILNEHGGIVDSIKTLLPKVVAADERPSDDTAFINYIDMFVNMVTHRLKMERLSSSGEHYSSSTILPKVYRTEYKINLAGRKDHPGVYYYRNGRDYITDVCMINMADNLFNREEVVARILEDDDGVYFYDVVPVHTILPKLLSRGVSASPDQSDFYKYVLSDCDDVREMIAYSKHTIDHRIEDALANDLIVTMHESDPVRYDASKCLDENIENVSVKTNLRDFMTTYYFERSSRLTRVIKAPPTQLNANDFVLRSFRLQWKGTDDNDTDKNVYVMYPLFAVVFKNLSLYQQVYSTQEEEDCLRDEEFSFIDGNQHTYNYNTTSHTYNQYATTQTYYEGFSTMDLNNHISATSAIDINDHTAVINYPTATDLSGAIDINGHNVTNHSSLDQFVLSTHDNFFPHAEQPLEVWESSALTLAPFQNSSKNGLQNFSILNERVADENLETSVQPAEEISKTLSNGAAADETVHSDRRPSSGSSSSLSVSSSSLLKAGFSMPKFKQQNREEKENSTDEEDDYSDSSHYTPPPPTSPLPHLPT